MSALVSTGGDADVATSLSAVASEANVEAIGALWGVDEVTCSLEDTMTNDPPFEVVKSAIDPSNSFVIIARHGLS